MRVLVLLALCLPGALAAAPKKHKPAAKPAASAPAAPVIAQVGVGAQVKLAMKDSRQIVGKVKGYDSVFLDVIEAQDKVESLGWVNIAAITTEDSGVDLTTLRARLTQEDMPAQVWVKPLDPTRAFTSALWPGIIVHGWGHRYAQDQDTFYTLVGAEIFGLIVQGFAVGEIAGPDVAGETKDTAWSLFYGGGAVVGVTWLWDMAFAPGTARQFNHDKGLSLLPTPTGVQLAYHF